MVRRQEAKLAVHPSSLIKMVGKLDISMHGSKGGQKLHNVKRMMVTTTMTIATGGCQGLAVKASTAKRAAAGKSGDLGHGREAQSTARMMGMSETVNVTGVDQ
jgi:hypothetical protein